MHYTPGFGDEITWPAYTGDANDPRAPLHDDDEPFTLEDAEKQAAEELACIPEHLAFLIGHGATETHVVNVAEIAETLDNGFPATFGELLVLLIQGDDKRSTQAKYILRDKLNAATAAQGYVAERAAELLQEVAQ